MNWKEFGELSLDYAKKFGESLPTEMMPPEDFDNAIEIMRECLKTGKPYEIPESTEKLLEQGAIF